MLSLIILQKNGMYKVATLRSATANQFITACKKVGIRRLHASYYDNMLLGIGIEETLLDIDLIL